MTVTADILHKLYTALEDEATPFMLTVHRLTAEEREADNTHRIVINTDDPTYFTAVLNDCKQKISNDVRI
jgi:hypothetical protein